MNPVWIHWAIYFVAGVGLEPRADEVREAASPSGGQGSEIFYDGELVEPEIKYETRVTKSLRLRNKIMNPVWNTL